MANAWFATIQSAEKTCIVSDGKKKVHYKFPSGEEMAEEYNLETSVVVRRAWKRNKSFCKTGEWEIEVGDPEPQNNRLDTIGIREDPNSPYMIKRLTKHSIEWRIRNLSYPLVTYSVTADPTEGCLVVRTTNKKYFKKIKIEELERTGLKPDQRSVEFTHKFNTLIITYKKPPEVIKLEKDILEDLKSVKAVNQGDLPCSPS